MADQPKFATVEEAVEDIRQGRMIVLVDDEDRENEGDLTIAAEKITPDIINFMATHGRGLFDASSVAATASRIGPLNGLGHLGWGRLLRAAGGGSSFTRYPVASLAACASHAAL